MFKLLCVLLLVPALVYGRAWGPCGKQNDFRLTKQKPSPVNHSNHFRSNIYFLLGNGEPHPQALRINNCNADHAPGCVVRRGQAAQIQLLFITLSPTTQLGAQLHALVGNNWFPWSLGNHADVCRSLAAGQCPAHQNTQLIYGFGLTIPGQAPAGADVRVRIRSWNQHRQVQFCVLIRVLVTN